MRGVIFMFSACLVSKLIDCSVLIDCHSFHANLKFRTFWFVVKWSCSPMPLLFPFRACNICTGSSWFGWKHSCLYLSEDCGFSDAGRSCGRDFCLRPLWLWASAWFWELYKLKFWASTAVMSIEVGFFSMLPIRRILWRSMTHYVPSVLEIVITVYWRVVLKVDRS